MPNVELPPPANILKSRLLEIRRAVDFAIQALDAQEFKASKADEIRVRRWICPNCGYQKSFTKPTNAETVEGCPKCGGIEFVPLAD